MKIITLTTDMGLSDHYVASLKGLLYRSVQNVQIVDISHSIRPFDISEAAYHLNACYKEFPEGTIHVVGVDSEPIINFGGSDGSFPCIMLKDGQYFVSIDNGFFGALLKENKADSFWRIDDLLSNPDSFKFPTKNILLKAAIRLLNGEKIENVASLSEGYKIAFTPVPISEPNLIKGYVIHIDNYGNAITNIHKSLFEQLGKGVPFTLYFKKKDYYIDVISNAYNDVPPGEKVAIFNENGYLEIAINRGASKGNGGAEQLFGLHRDDLIRIEFMPPGSRQTLESLF